MSIGIDIDHSSGAFRLYLREHMPPGFTALVGPSGSGKTTVLNVIAGVTRPARAVVTLDDTVLADTARKVWLAPHRRHVGYVFQEPRLFPHLTVRQNLLYGRWFQRRRAPLAASGVIDLLNLSGLLDRPPSRLSGGEQQRVALGRALLSAPRLLLLDEPLASIDQAHRLEILRPISIASARLHQIPTIYVTHTWAEVASRADHVLALGDGRVVFSGPAARFASESGELRNSPSRASRPAKLPHAPAVSGCGARRPHLRDQSWASSGESTLPVRIFTRWSASASSTRRSARAASISWFRELPANFELALKPLEREPELGDARAQSSRSNASAMPTATRCCISVSRKSARLQRAGRHGQVDLPPLRHKVAAGHQRRGDLIAGSRPVS
jgi:ABC-type sulfate/molybdate transport systems ATPase subunit